MNIVRRQAPNPAPLVTQQQDWDPFRVMRDFVRWDPFREMGILPTEGLKTVFVPDVDVKETPEGYIFKADVPGIKEKDVEISLTGNRLTLSGRREEERREEHATYYTCERSYGSFTRSFTLPPGTDVDRVRADMKDGVLTINVPKKPEVQAKRIPVGNLPEKEKAKA